MSRELDRKNAQYLDFFVASQKPFCHKCIAHPEVPIPIHFYDLFLQLYHFPLIVRDICQPLHRKYSPDRVIETVTIRAFPEFETICRLIVQTQNGSEVGCLSRHLSKTVNSLLRVKNLRRQLRDRQTPKSIKSEIREFLRDVSYFK